MKLLDIIQIFRDKHVGTVARETEKSYKYLLNDIAKEFGEYELSDITTDKLAQYLIKQPTYKQLKIHTMLSMLFKEAYFSAGFTSKPMVGLRRPTKIRGRGRLTDDSFNYIYSKADQKLRTFMNVANLTGQRPADVLLICQRAKNHEFDELDVLTVQQSKTKHVVEMQIGPQLREVLKDIRQLPASVDMASRSFSKIARELPDTHKPTLYELRSFSLSQADDAQALAGHTQMQQTKVYLQGHSKVFKTQTR